MPPRARPDPAPASEGDIAAFDFDGTLTTKDSFFRFITRHRAGGPLAIDLLATAPWLLLYAARLVGNDAHKMALFARPFSGMPLDRFRALARDFSLNAIPALLNPVAMDRLHFHQRQGHRVVIVSASIGDWIEPWAAREGIAEVIASRIEVRDDRLTGRLDGLNCHGPEKLRRFLARHPDRSAYRLHVYGDSRGDAALLAAADHRYYRRFA